MASRQNHGDANDDPGRGREAKLATEPEETYYQHRGPSEVMSPIHNYGTSGSPPLAPGADAAPDVQADAEAIANACADVHSVPGTEADPEPDSGADQIPGADAAPQEPRPLASEQDTRHRQLSLGSAAVVSHAKTKFRMGVRNGYERLAKRLGMMLVMCSFIHVLTLIVVRINANKELCAYMTNAFSILAFMLHLALTLAHDRMRGQCAAHFGLIVLDALVNAAIHLARREFISAAYFFVGWGGGVC